MVYSRTITRLTVKCTVPILPPSPGWGRTPSLSDTQETIMDKVKGKNDRMIGRLGQVRAGGRRDLRIGG